MNRFTRGLAMASARHPWRTIASWILLMAAVFALAGAVGGTFVDDYSAKGSQSARATELITENFPEAAKATALVVFASQDDQPLEARRADIADVLADVAEVAHVESVGDPFADGTISDDGQIGYAQLDAGRTSARPREAGVHGDLRGRVRCRGRGHPGGARW